MMETTITEVGTGILYVKNDQAFYVDSCRNWQIVAGDILILEKQAQTAQASGSPGESSPATKAEKSGNQTEKKQINPKGLPPAEPSKKADTSRTGDTVIELGDIDWDKDHDPGELLDSAT